MKTIISVVTFLLCMFGFYWLDSIAIEAILKVIPKSANEWLDLIKITLWVVAFVFTGGLALSLSSLISVVIYSLVDTKR